MRTIDAETSNLLIIDIQTRLLPAIHEGAAVISNASRLLRAAAMMNVPRLFTEQNPKGLGPTVPELASDLSNSVDAVEKMTFDACRAPGFVDRLPDRPTIVIAGCEAHVCVLQTTLGLLDMGRKVYVVSDALGSRRIGNKDAAIQRMERHGAEIVTTEMVIFEWLGSAENALFRKISAMIK